MRADGSAYVPATDSWVPVAIAPIPGRTGAQAVWTGSRLVISGGYHEGDDDDRTDGAALDPVSGAWSPIAARPAPGSCGGDSPCDGIWTGVTALFPASGLAYDPVADRWAAVAPYPATSGPVVGEPTVWSGRRLLAWGVPTDVVRRRGRRRRRRHSRQRRRQRRRAHPPADRSVDVPGPPTAG